MRVPRGLVLQTCRRHTREAWVVDYEVWPWWLSAGAANTYHRYISPFLWLPATQNDSDIQCEPGMRDERERGGRKRLLLVHSFFMKCCFLTSSKSPEHRGAPSAQGVFHPPCASERGRERERGTLFASVVCGSGIAATASRFKLCRQPFWQAVSLKSSHERKLQTWLLSGKGCISSRLEHLSSSSSSSVGGVLWDGLTSSIGGTRAFSQPWKVLQRSCRRELLWGRPPGQRSSRASYS